MRVELVSLNRDFHSTTLLNYDGDLIYNIDFDDNWNKVYDAIIERIKASEADLLVFSGGALPGKKFSVLECEYKRMKNKGELTNSNISVVVEEWGKNRMYVLNCDNGSSYSYTESQLFSESKDFYNKNNNKLTKNKLLQAYYDKLSSNIFQINGRNCVIVQCGEINFLQGRCDKKHGDTVNIRNFNSKSKDIAKSYNSLLNDKVDIVLNVIHTPMGEAGAVQAKWRWLSGNNDFITGEKVCFSVSSCMQKDEAKIQAYQKEHPNCKSVKYYSRIQCDKNNYKNMLNKKSFQKGYKGGREILKEVASGATCDYVWRLYEI